MKTRRGEEEEGERRALGGWIRRSLVAYNHSLNSHCVGRGGGSGVLVCAEVRNVVALLSKLLPVSLPCMLLLRGPYPLPEKGGFPP